MAGTTGVPELVPAATRFGIGHRESRTARCPAGEMDRAAGHGTLKRRSPTLPRYACCEPSLRLYGGPCGGSLPRCQPRLSSSRWQRPNQDFKPHLCGLLARLPIGMDVGGDLIVGWGWISRRS